MRTRRTNKQENAKTKKMCDRLNRAESAKVRPDIEGELPDMPVLEVDEDFQEQAASTNKKRSKRNSKVENNNEDNIDEKLKEKNSLFHKFNLAEKLEEIEKAEQDKNYAKIIEDSSKLSFLFKLLDSFRAEKKRVLIFSMSKKMLNVIE